MSVLLAVLLQFSPVRAPVPAANAVSVERWVTGAFRSDAEATNFSAHVAWSLAVPLAARTVAGPKGLYLAGGTWIAYSVLNELAFHGPESARERNLNLVSRLVPCAVVMLVEWLR